MITGNLSSVVKSALSNANECVNVLPDVVDDLHICGRDVNIDGSGKILGSAGPSYVREEAGKETTVTGIMEFDVADVADLVSAGTWEAVILHEIGKLICLG